MNMFEIIFTRSNASNIIILIILFCIIIHLARRLILQYKFDHCIEKMANIFSFCDYSLLNNTSEYMNNIRIGELFGTYRDYNYPTNMATIDCESSVVGIYKEIKIEDNHSLPDITIPILSKLYIVKSELLYDAMSKGLVICDDFLKTKDNVCIHFDAATKNIDITIRGMSITTESIHGLFKNYTLHINISLMNMIYEIFKVQFSKVKNAIGLYITDFNTYYSNREEFIKEIKEYNSDKKEKDNNAN